MSKASKHIHIRAREGTRKKLKVLSVLMGVPMSEMLDRIVNAEAEKHNLATYGDALTEEGE